MSAARPLTTSDSVGIGLSVTVTPARERPDRHHHQEQHDQVRERREGPDRLRSTAIAGIAPFDLWETPDASVALTAPLLPGKTAQVKLILQQKTPAAIKSYAVDVSVSYKDGDGIAVTKVIKNAGIVKVGNINFLSAGIRWIIEQLYKLVHSYALAIILLTLLLKLITEPLTRMQFKSTVDMQKLQPQIAKLKAKYPNKDDAQKLNEETMKLYKDNNVSLFSGCLPLLVQWPIFLALFTAINNYSPFNNAPFLWAPASPWRRAPCPWLHGSSCPSLSRLRPTCNPSRPSSPGQDRSQTAMLTYFMPLLLGYWAYGFSIALALYWALFSLFSAGQQYLVIKRLTKGMAVPEPVVKKSAKKK